MREVEVLHDIYWIYSIKILALRQKMWLLWWQILTNTHPIFRQFSGKKMGNAPQIPFSLSDNKLSESDVLVSSYLTLLRLKESNFSAEDVLALLDIPAMRERFNISLADLPFSTRMGSRFWDSFRFAKNQDGINFNSWQAGLERMI